MEQEQRAEPEPESEQAYAHNASDPDFRSSMTARLANALYWTFSGLAGILALLVLLAVA